VWDAEAARVCLSSGVDRALVRVAAVEPISELPSGAEALLPRVAREADVAPLMAWAESSPVTVGNLGVLRAVAPAGAASADWPLNVTNAESAGVVSELGARMVWASPELTRTQLAEVARRSPIPVGSLVYGRAELMVTEHCVLRAAGACSQRCETCERRGDWWRLRDVKGYEFPVTTDADGRTHVMNSATLDLVRVLGEVLSTGVSAIRLDFSDEPIDRVAEVTSTVREALDAVLAGGAAPEVKLAENTTSGHFFRGVR
jgi:putative protease